MTNYRLGLDVGTNSLGWSVLRTDDDGNPVAIEATGSRIFSDGRDSKSKATLAADRREARSARRRRDRYKQRRAFLLAALTEAGLFPAEDNKTERAALQVLNPLELRARLLNEKPADILKDIAARTGTGARKKGEPTTDAEAVGKKGIEGVQALAREKGIRRIRCFGPKQAIPIKDKYGKLYKGYQGDSNWGMEIYAFPEGHKKADKWEGVVISRFDANKPGFQSGTTYRPEPTAKLVMRLQINDCIEIEENGKKRLMRVQKMDQPNRLYLAPPNEANVANRNSDKDNEFKFLAKSANALRDLNPRKVHISPTGQVSYESRRKPRRKKK